MKLKAYQLVGIEVAVDLLRPGAKWEICNGRFTRWEDPRPCPSIEEVFETIEKIKEFEDSIDTVFLPEQLKGRDAYYAQIESAYDAKS